MIGDLQLHGQRHKDDEPEPWLRMVDEPPQEFAVFEKFLDLGPERSIPLLRKITRLPKKRLYDWRKRWDWESRVLAWDRECGRRRRKANLAAVSRMAERHAKLGAKMLEKAEKSLRKVTQKALAESPSTLTALTRAAAEMERRARLGAVEADQREAEVEADEKPGLRVEIGLRKSGKARLAVEVEEGAGDGEGDADGNGQVGSGSPEAEEEAGGTGGESEG